MKIGTRFRTAGGAIVEVEQAKRHPDLVVAKCGGCDEESTPASAYRIRDEWINEHIAVCHALPAK